MIDTNDDTGTLFAHIATIALLAVWCAVWIGVLWVVSWP